MTEPAAPVALVTGASSGIGRAIALELAGRGYDLVVTARRKELLEALRAEVLTTHGRRVVVIAADLGLRSDCERVEAAIGEGVDILVANAGFSTRGWFPRLPVETEVAEVELNVPRGGRDDEPARSRPDPGDELGRLLPAAAGAGDLRRDEGFPDLFRPGAGCRAASGRRFGQLPCARIHVDGSRRTSPAAALALVDERRGGARRGGGVAGGPAADRAWAALEGGGGPGPAGAARSCPAACRRCRPAHAGSG